MTSPIIPGVLFFECAHSGSPCTSQRYKVDPHVLYNGEMSIVKLVLSYKVDPPQRVPPSGLRPTAEQQQGSDPSHLSIAIVNRKTYTSHFTSTLTLKCTLDNFM